MIPNALHEFAMDDSWIDTPDKIRLSPTERLELENRKFIHSLSWVDRYLKELIEGHRIVEVTAVNFRDGGAEYHAIYDNGIEVIVPRRLYYVSPVQKERYSL